MSEYKPGSDLIRKINLTSEDISNAINSYTFENDKYRNEEVEWRLRLPMFVVDFYNYIIKYNKIPTQDEYYNYYIESHPLVFSEEKFKDVDIIHGVKTRALRAHASLLRDVHFLKYVTEQLKLDDNFKDAKTSYNTYQDTVDGIDLMIVHDNRYYAVNLFVNTKNSYDARLKKVNRHKNITNITNMIDIELPITIDFESNVGKFVLYGNEEYLKLIEIINGSK